MAATYHELTPTFSQVPAVYSKNLFLGSQHDGVPSVWNIMLLLYV